MRILLFSMMIMMVAGAGWIGAEPYAPWAAGYGPDQADARRERADEAGTDRSGDASGIVPDKADIDLPPYPGSRLIAVSGGDSETWPNLTLVTSDPLPEVRRFYLNETSELPDWHFDGRYDLFFEGASFVMSMTQQAPSLSLQKTGEAEMDDERLAEALGDGSGTIIRVVYRSRR